MFITDVNRTLANKSLKVTMKKRGSCFFATLSKAGVVILKDLDIDCLHQIFWLQQGQYNFL